ncbi:MAG: hypothetical protein KDA72_08940 [Planctomycetales bacterium]|nr:hypothetical protein [Planctomycetales bacterium]
MLEAANGHSAIPPFHHSTLITEGGDWGDWDAVAGGAGEGLPTSYQTYSPARQARGASWLAIFTQKV